MADPLSDIEPQQPERPGPGLDELSLEFLRPPEPSVPPCDAPTQLASACDLPARCADKPRGYRPSQLNSLSVAVSCS